MSIGGLKKIASSITSNKRVLIPLAAIVLIGGVVGGYFYVKNNRDKTSVNMVGECREDNFLFYAKLAKAFGENDIATLDDIIPKISEVPVSKEGLNCLAAIVKYHLFISDIATAEEYYKKVESIADVGTKLNAEYSAIDINTVADLKAEIDYYKQLEEQGNENAITF